jgi:predicted metal-dependent enzyme (double-stranded beta helix superfamily)
MSDRTSDTLAATSSTSSIPPSPAMPVAQQGALHRFVQRLEQITGEAGTSEPAVVEGVSTAMRELVAHDDWLDETFTKPHPQYYQQYLLHADPAGRFSVVSFVWGPGQATPVHDHGTWGVIGMLRGAETGQMYRREPDRLVPVGEAERLEPGHTAAVSPDLGDIHVVRNAFDDRVSISIHAYGGDIGKQRRYVYDPATGAAKEFVSGYANVPKNTAP